MTNLYELLARAAPTSPDRLALRQDDATRSFGDLDARAGRVARAIADGLLGRRIAVLADNTPEFFEIFFGAARVGAVIIPLNTRLTATEQLALLEDGEADTLVVDERHVKLGTSVEARQMMPVVRLGAAWETLLAGVAGEPPSPSAGGDEVAMILYTSGTTGRPKGVQLTHINLEAYMHAGEFAEIGPDSLCLMSMPLFHIGSIGLSLSALTRGMGVLLIAPKAALMLDAIERLGATHMFVVPTVLAAMVDEAERRRRTYTSIRQIVYGGSPIDTTTLRRILTTFTPNVRQGYGMTEVGSVSQLMPEDHDVSDARCHLLGSVGRPRPEVEVRIVDPVTLDDLPQGSAGEVLVRSAMVTPGYWKRPDLTAEAIAPGGWFRTGDCGYLDPEGYLFLTSRLKDMIVSGGENVYPQEVEEVLMSHPDIVEAAVVGLPDPRWGEIVAAFVVARDGSDLAPRDVTAYVAERLARYKAPKVIELIGELPRNANGKLVRHTLKQSLAQGARA